jgi:hypothetical protein
MVVMIPAAIAARPAAETAAGDPCTRELLAAAGDTRAGNTRSAELLAATSAHAATHAHAAAAHMAAATHVAAAAHMGAAAATASTVILGETGGWRCRQRQNQGQRGHRTQNLQIDHRGLHQETYKLVA